MIRSGKKRLLTAALALGLLLAQLPQKALAARDGTAAAQSVQAQGAYPVCVLQKTGSDRDNIVILILAEGYVQGRQETFLNDARQRLQGMMQMEPYSRFARYINVYAVPAVSNEAGVSVKSESGESEEDIIRDTYFGIKAVGKSAAFRTDYDYAGKINALRGWMESAYLDSGAGVNALHFLIDTPSTLGSASGIYSFSSNSSYANGNVLAHELSHSLGKLGDEYGRYTTFANTSDTADPGRIKWKDLLGFRSIRIIQGNHSAIWIPTDYQCNMYEAGHAFFCEVCRLQMVRRFSGTVQNGPGIYVAHPEITTEHARTADSAACRITQENLLTKAKDATLELRTAIQNLTDQARTVTLRLAITGADGTEKLKAEQRFTVPALTDSYDMDAACIYPSVSQELWEDLEAGDRLTGEVVDTASGAVLATYQGPEYVTYTVHCQLADGQSVPDTLPAKIPLEKGTDPAVLAPRRLAGRSLLEAKVSGQTLTLVYDGQAPDPAPTPQAVRLTLAADKSTLTGGGTVALTVKADPSAAPLGGVTVTCSDAAVIPGGSGASWTAQLPDRAGTYTFTATRPGDALYQTATATVRVTVQEKPAALTGLYVTGDTFVQIPAAGAVTVRLTAAARYSDGREQTVTPQAEWSVEHYDGVSTDQTGAVTIRSSAREGSVTVRAAYQGKTAEHRLDLKKTAPVQAPVSLKLTADPPRLTGGGSVALTVTADPPAALSGVTVTCPGIAVKKVRDGVWSADLPNADGTYTFTATLPESAQYRYAEAADTVQVTKQPAATQTRITAPAAGQRFILDKDTLTLGAAVTAGNAAVQGGTVQFYVNGRALGAPVAVSGGSAVLAGQGVTQAAGFSAGVNAITARYAGSGHCAPSDSAAVNVTATLPEKAYETLPGGVRQGGCTYGQTLPAPSYTVPAGTLSVSLRYDGTTFGGSIYSSVDAPTQAGQYTLSVTCETDATVYSAVSPIFTVARAVPKGTPSYTPITASGKTLSAAALGVGRIVPAGGRIAWDLPVSTVVTAGTAYGWTYTPNDTGNYTTLTGRLIPYAASGGGGSSGGGGGSVTPVTGKFAVQLDVGPGGTASLGQKEAEKGQTVTVTVRPNDGYQVAAVTATAPGSRVDVTKLDDTRYQFTMPAAAVTVSVTFRQTQPETPEVNFSDVSAASYYYDAVKWAVSKQITGGTGNNQFSPNSPCTRAQIVTFLWRAAGSPTPQTGVNPFTDVSETAYYYKAVLWAMENGITGGTGSGQFSPNAVCTRGQGVTFLHRASGTPASGTAGFSDVTAGSYYAKAVAWASEKGITGGTGNGQFSPNVPCTRAQIVTFLFRSAQ